MRALGRNEVCLFLRLHGMQEFSPAQGNRADRPATDAGYSRDFSLRILFFLQKEQYFENNFSF